MSDPFTLSNSHNVVIRGILIQISSRVRKQRLRYLNNLFEEIQTFKADNKQTSSQLTRERLFLARQELCSLLIHQHDSHPRSLKAHSYNYGNKVCKLLAHQLKEKMAKQKIAYLIDKDTNGKMYNPKGIADAFSFLWLAIQPSNTS